MKVSVIVPVYNVEQYLESCIESILLQSFTDFELILIDDGSSDNCGLICDQYSEIDSRIKVLHKTNGGLSSARNAGLDIASGELVTFVDSDDVIHPQMIEKMLAILEETNADIVSTGLKTFRSDSPFILDVGDINYQVLMRNEFIDQLYPENFGKISVSACGKIYRMKLFDSIRFPEGLIYEDLHIYLNVLMNCKIITVTDTYLYFNYVNPASITRSNYLKYDRFGEFTVREGYVQYFSEHGLFNQSRMAQNDYLTFFMRNYFAVTLKYKTRLNDLKPHIKVYKKHLKGILCNPYVCRMRKVCALSMLFFPRFSYFLAKNTIPDCLLEEMR